jgi:hypothetical protein
MYITNKSEVQMDINISDVQVTENRAVTTRMAALLGTTIDALETYNMTAEPDESGAYGPIEINTVSFKYINGMIIKSNGVSEYIIPNTEGATIAHIIGKSLLLDRPLADVALRNISIQPMYNILDYAVVEDAVYEDDKWTLTIKDRNYVYSSITGTPITGKLEMLGRRLILSSEGRIAELVIDTVLREGDDIETMTSDEYHTRVAEELQSKLNYFFGDGYCNAGYDTDTSCYVFSLKEAGEIAMGITSSRAEDLSYFGMRCPTVKLGSEDMENPTIRFLAGNMAAEGDISVTLAYPNKMETTDDAGTWDPADIIGATFMLCETGDISYEVILYK